MKALDVINRLKELVDKYGNCDVGIYNPVELEFEELGIIKSRLTHKNDRKIFKGIFFGITNYEIGDWFRQIEIKDYDNDKD